MVVLIFRNNNTLANVRLVTKALVDIFVEEPKETIDSNYHESIVLNMAECTQRIITN